MEQKIKHLEFIQTTINRMAGNSFLLKGWTVTLTGGLLALTFKQIDRRYLDISIAILIVFWLLDSYYLAHERKFIALFNRVRKQPGDTTDFSMDTKPFGGFWSWLRCSFSVTMTLFYGGLLVVILCINHFL
jgi:hypothetical protein